MGVVSGFCEGPFAFQGKADWKPIVDLGQAEDTAAAHIWQDAMHSAKYAADDTPPPSYGRYNGFQERDCRIPAV